MSTKFKQLIVGIGFAALPTIFLIGCGGGSNGGGILSPTAAPDSTSTPAPTPTSGGTPPSPTPTSGPTPPGPTPTAGPTPPGPTSTPLPTPTATALPAGEEYVFTGDFSKVTAPFVKPIFKAAGGQSSFHINAPDNYTQVIFQDGRETRGRQVSIFTTEPNPFRIGDTVPVVKTFVAGSAGCVVSYVDYTHNVQRFDATGGSLKIVGLTRIPVAGTSQTLTTFQFKLTGVTMAPVVGAANSTGSFTINGSGLYRTSKSQIGQPD